MSNTSTTILHRDPSLSLYRTATGFTAVTSVRDRNGQVVQSFFDVNESAVDLLSCIDGQRSVAEVVREFCRRKDGDPKVNEPWILEFLLSLQERAVIKPGRCESPPLRIVGDEDWVRPAQMTVEITDSCNLECGHCYLSASPLGRRYMRLETFRGIVAKFKENHGLSIELTGGEVCMNPDFDDILSLALREFSVVGVLTNGTILRDSTLEILRSHRHHVTVGISLDSVRHDIHDRIRGRRKAFERTTRNIRRLTDAGIKVRIGAVIFEDNMWELRDLAQMAIDLGACLFSFNFVEGFGRGADFQERSGIQITAEYSTYIQDVLEEFEGIIPIVAGEQYQGRVNCGAGSAAIVVDASGQVRPCVLFPSTLSLGNVLTSSWEDVFDQDLFKDLSRIPTPNQEHGCPATCPLFATCYRCYLKGLAANMSKSPEERCPWVHKNSLHRFVDAFAERGWRS